MKPWKDSTSYAQGRERIQTCWSVEVAPGYRITITNGHIHHRGEWIMHSDPWFNTKSIGSAESMTPEQAQTKAATIVFGKVAELYHALQALNS